VDPWLSAFHRCEAAVAEQHDRGDDHSGTAIAHENNLDRVDRLTDNFRRGEDKREDKSRAKSPANGRNRRSIQMHGLLRLSAAGRSVVISESEITI